MKVLLINKNHFVVGGADSVYFNTGNLLNTNNIEVVYFSTKNIKNNSNKFENYFSDEVVTRDISIFKKILSSFKYLYNFKSAKKLRNLIDKEKPDIAHIHLFYGTLSSSILIALKKLKIPIVLTIHDYRLLCPANAMLDKNNNICEKCANSSNLNCIRFKCSENNFFQSLLIGIEATIRQYFINPIDYVSQFIFVSKFSLHKHLYYNENFLNKSNHLYNFYIKQTLENFEKGDYFFFYGRLSKEKGIITLIESFKVVKYNLVIVGSGPLSDYVIESTKLNCNIKYLGFKSGFDLENLIKGSSFVVVPSEWYENNPMTIIESFSLGKPVIGANIGGIPELIINGNGFLFESKNISDLVSKIHLASSVSLTDYNKFSKSCYNFSKKYFNNEFHFRELLKIYNKAISEYK
jgi:glycosyltransferase involved in cell wall biosynthesis